MRTESIIRTLEGLFININLCTEEDFKRVDTLVINRTDFDGSILDADFKDLLQFKNLFYLTIDGFMIDNELIELLASIPSLKRLTLINCDVIEIIDSSFAKLNINDLTLINVDFNLALLKNSYREIRLEAVPFKYFEGYCDRLNVSQCFIDDVDNLLKINFDELSISNELYLQNQLKFDDSKKKINVMEENGQFILKKVGFDG